MGSRLSDYQNPVAPFFHDHPDDLESRMIENIPQWNESRQQFLNEILRITLLPLRDMQRAVITLQDRQLQLGAAMSKTPQMSTNADTTTRV